MTTPKIRNSKWYVVYTNPRSEKKAAELLSKKGIEVYLPLHKVLKLWSDRKKWVEIPLFPSYLFVRINPKSYYEVLDTPHISRYIFFDKKPAIIRENQLDALRQVTQSMVEMTTTSDDIKPGDRVKIMGGPFQGFEAEMVTLKGLTKILIRIEQIGHSVMVNIPLSYIIPDKK